MNAVKALDAAFHARRNAGFFYFAAENVLNACKKLLSFFSPRLDRVMHLLISNRVKIAETEVLKFAANLAHSEAVRNGAVDIEGLARDFLLPIRRQVLKRAHVVQAVGKLNKHHANI